MSLSTTSTCLLNTSRDGDSTTSLGSLSNDLTTLSVKKFFLISNLNLPWCNLRPFPLVLLLVTWENRLRHPPATTSFQVVVESNKVSPEPPFLQAKQPQFPQPLLWLCKADVSLPDLVATHRLKLPREVSAVFTELFFLYAMMCC